MTRSQVIVQAVKAEYPKFSKAALSLASRSYETGVMFTPRAKELKEAAERATTPHKRTFAKRVKSIHFSCRMRESDARRVKREMWRRGITSTQDLIEGLLLQWAGESEKEPSPMDETGDSSGGNGFGSASLPK